MQNQTPNGVMLVVVSALVFSSAGLFAKGVEAGAWDIIFWRGVFAAALTTCFIWVRGASTIEFKNMGWQGLAAAVAGASGTAAFITAFKLTSIANVSLIYAIAPLLAGLLAWIWFRETPSKSMMIGALVTFLGVIVIFSGSLGSVNLVGDLLTLWMTIAMAGLLVLYRRYPDTPAAGPAALSSVLLLPFGMWLGKPLEVPTDEIAITACFGLVFALASVTLVEGAKRLPSSETALLSTLEAPFAPVLAWLVLSELPPVLTIVGGALILVGVVGSQLFEKREIVKY